MSPMRAGARAAHHLEHELGDAGLWGCSTSGHQRQRPDRAPRPRRVASSNSRSTSSPGGGDAGHDPAAAPRAGSRGDDRLGGRVHRVAWPGAYAMSKHAMEAFSDSLRPRAAALGRAGVAARARCHRDRIWQKGQRDADAVERSLATAGDRALPPLIRRCARPRRCRSACVAGRRRGARRGARVHGRKAAHTLPYGPRLGHPEVDLTPAGQVGGCGCC